MNRVSAAPLKCGSGVLCCVLSTALNSVLCPASQAHLTWAPTVHTPLRCLPLQAGSMKRQSQWSDRTPDLLSLLVLTGLRNSNLASQGNSWVLGFKELTGTHLIVIVQPAKAYLEVEHKTAFGFSPQTFTLRLGKCHFPLENPLFLCGFYSSCSKRHFCELYLRRKKTENTEGGTEKAQPWWDRVEQSACPDRKCTLQAAPTFSFLLSPFRLGANVQEEIHIIALMWLNLNKLGS